MRITKRIARTDLYEKGCYTPDETKKSGYKFTRKKPSPNGDTLVVKKGQEYYSWGIWGENKLRISSTPPTPSDLTKSKFLLRMYEIKSSLNNITKESSEKEIEEVRGALIDLLNECTTSLKNIPEHLRGNKAGMLLKERIEYINELINREYGSSKRSY